MLEALPLILEIQEFDMQMIQLMRVKKERQKELDNINACKRRSASESQHSKETEIIELKKNMRLMEGEVSEIMPSLKKLETQQNAVKKVEEFNALTHEMSHADRERIAKEQRLSDHYENLPLKKNCS